MRKIIVLLLVVLLQSPVFAQDTTLTVTPEGKVGIGTNNPDARLHVNGGSIINSVTIGKDAIGIDYPYEYETIGVLNKGKNLRLQSPGSIIFHTGEALSANVGISPAGLDVTGLLTGAGLQVNGNAEVTSNLNVDGTFQVNGDAVVENNLSVKNGFYIGKAGVLGQQSWEFGVDDGPHAYFDFHAAPSHTDYASRIIRNGGDNSDFQLINKGTGAIKFYANDQNTVTIASNGCVGINISNPTKAKLEIDGHSGYLLEYNKIGHYTVNTHGHWEWKNKGGASIYASNRIYAGEYIAFSDARIKNIVCKSNSKKDLEALLAIEIIDYTMIDTVAKGNRLHKKVIGQQVKSVYPQAVSIARNEVPDIYKRATVKNGWIALQTKLTPGERVRIITENAVEIYKVLQVNSKGFRVNLPADVKKAFVYGREVDDFHTVDYEAIAMLNVSATQQLYRLIEKQQAQIQTQNAKLVKSQARNKALTIQNSVFEKRMAAIEKRLQRIDDLAENKPRPVPGNLSQALAKKE